MSAAAGQRRLFVGLELPAELARRCASLASATLQAPGWRFHVPQDLHLTLCFRGWVPEQVAAGLTDPDGALARAVRASACFGLLPGACGGFPQAERARVAWLAPEPQAELVELERGVRAALAARLAPEEAQRPPFGGQAHVTLARRERTDGVSLPPEFLRARAAGAWPVERATLYETAPGAPSPDGRRYRALAHFPLSRGRGAPA